MAKRLYQVYKTNGKNGDQKLLGTVSANTSKSALDKAVEDGLTRSKRGRFLVLPYKTRVKGTFIDGK